MKLKRLSTILLCLIFLVTILSTAGVYAIWEFSSGTINESKQEIGAEMGEFTWQGSEILPDDEEAGEDHVWLIENLVAGVNANGTGIGLNNPNSDLNQYINDRLKGGLGWKRDYFGSMAVTGDDEMEELFGAAARGLSFIIEVDENDSNKYFIYTTSEYLGERGEPNWLGTSNKTPGKPTYPIGSYNEIIYRTELVRESSTKPFNIIETKKGKALSAWYDENRRNANITQIPAFNVDSWVEIA
jgi:hypothetical protein